jgi:Mg2+/citrate symporter
MGITFLVLAGFFGSMLEAMETPPTLFAIIGAAYVAIALGLFIGRRLFTYLGAIVPLAWACVGILHYTMKQHNPIVFPFVAMEIIVILCCCYLILCKRSS